MNNTKRNRGLMKKSWSTKTKVNNKYIILALNIKAVHAIIATMDMPDGVLARAKRAKTISDAAAKSDFVTTPPAIITTLNGLITFYSNASIDERETAYRKLLAALKALMATFQTAADNDIDKAEAIITSGEFGIKKIVTKQKSIFKAENGIDSGTIDLTAEGGGPHTCHDWMYSADGKVFVRMAPTVAANTQMKGLTPGEYAYFTHELVTKKGGQGVSQIIKILVK